MENNIYSNEDTVAKNKDVTTPIVNSFYTELEMHDFCDKLGFEYFDKYYTRPFNDEYVIFINNKKNAIFSFEKNECMSDGYELDTVITFKNGKEQVSYGVNNMEFETIISNIISVKENNLDLIETPINTIRMLYNKEFLQMTYFPSNKSDKAINEKLLQDIKKLNQNTNFEHKLIQVIEDNYKKDKEDSRKFNKKYSSTDIFNKKYHRYSTTNERIIDYSYSEDSFHVESIGTTYVLLEKDGNASTNSEIYVSKSEFDNFFKDNDLLFEEYKNVIVDLLKNIANDKLIESILEDKPYIKDTRTDYIELYAADNSFLDVNYYVISDNFNINLCGTGALNEGIHVYFDFDEISNPMLKKDLTTKQKGTPLDVLLSYAETKDKDENKYSIDYYDNLYNEINDLSKIVNQLNLITKTNFCNSELDSLFKKCNKNIDSALYKVNEKRAEISMNILYGR